MKYLVIVVMLLTLPGCVSNFWFNPQKTAIDGQNDTNECDYEALKYSRDGSGRNEALFQKCMNNKGYLLVNKYTILSKGNEYYHQKRYDLALMYYERAAYDFPTAHAVYHNMGAACLYLKKYDLALKHFDKAISIDPSNTWSYSGRGFAYLEKGKLDKALEDFEKALALDPKSPYPYIGKGAYSIEKKKYDNAIDELNKSILLANNDSDIYDAYYYLGNAYYKKKNLELAIPNFKKACDLSHEEACIKYKKLSRE